MAVMDGKSGGSFWTTIPGCLTGLAALIGAIAGLVAALVHFWPLLHPFLPTAGATLPFRPGFRVVSVALAADPLDYQGACPVIIKFSGSISAMGGSGTVTYRFLRSDHTLTPWKSVTFERPETKDVDDTWPRGSPGVTYSGWEQVQIRDPASGQSDQARFTLHCR
jgi:hypothetical protein